MRDEAVACARRKSCPRAAPLVLALLFLLFLPRAPVRAAGAVRRVASLAPSLTELICDLGYASNLVGRSSACDFPPAARTAPVVGDFGRPTLEAILAARADLLVLTDAENAAALDAVRARGVRVRVLPCERWDELAAAAKSLAEEFGEPRRGLEWADALQARRRALAGRLTDVVHRPSVFVEVWGDPLTTAGRDSFLSEVIALAGGRNVGDALPGRYVAASAEWVLAEQPDVLLLTYMPSDSAPDLAALSARAGWASLRAIQRKAVIRDLPADLLLRPGPRLIDGAERLADALSRVRGATRP